MKALTIIPTQGKYYCVNGFEDFSHEEFADIVCILNQMRMQMDTYDKNLNNQLESHNLFNGERNNNYVE
jgi:hypothetical protein